MNIKRYTVLLIALLALFMLTACSARGAVRSLDAAEDAVERKMDTAEDAVEDAIRSAVIPASPKPKAATPESRVSPEKAQEIALSHAGFSADQVSGLRAEFEYDDRITHYDVSFREGRWEYEYEIHAETGEILSWERDD